MIAAPHRREEPLNDVDIQTLRESFRRIVPRADALAQTFYDTLFERYPGVLPLFEGVRFDEQRKKLVRALALIVRHLEQPDFLRAYLQGLGAIHLAYGVRPEHYPAVGDCLLRALAETAGKGWSEAEEAAWRGAFGLIADTMLNGARKTLE
jgi:hemoglobin-like flavoprotein